MPNTQEVLSHLVHHIHVQSLQISTLSQTLDTLLKHPEKLNDPMFRVICKHLVDAPNMIDAPPIEKNSMSFKTLNSINKFAMDIGKEIARETLSFYNARVELCEGYMYQYCGGDGNSFSFKDLTTVDHNKYVSDMGGMAIKVTNGAECPQDSRPALFAMDLLNLVSKSHQKVISVIKEHGFKIIEETPNEVYISTPDEQYATSSPHWISTFMR